MRALTADVLAQKYFRKAGVPARLKKVEENDAALRDMCLGILSTKTLADLEKPGARNLIRTELLNGFNNVLGDNSIAEIYITEFGIQ